jgi:hypothetical protein
MSADDMIAAVSLGVESALSKMGFLRTKDAPPAPKPVTPKVTGKRTLSPEHLAKMQAGRKAKAAKGKAKPVAAKPDAKPKPAPAVKAAGVTVKTGAPALTVEDYTTSKGVDGKIVKVGVFSTFVPEGDDAKAQAVLDTVNVIRGDKDAVIATLRAIGCNV